MAANAATDAATDQRKDEKEEHKADHYSCNHSSSKAAEIWLPTCSVCVWGGGGEEKGIKGDGILYCYQQSRYGHVRLVCTVTNYCKIQKLQPISGNQL